MNAYPTRTIAYICELYHPPRPPSAEAIQSLHNRYFSAGNSPYSSFAVTPIGPVLTNPGTRPGALSQVVFLADRMQFREELGALTCEAFGERVHRIAADVCALGGIDAIAGQQVTIRTLVNPRKFENAAEYMRDGLFGFGEMVDVFEAEPQIYGMRMVFPPLEDRPAAHALRIENYAQDPRTLYLENQSTFGQLQVADGLGAVETRVAETYEFLVERSLNFVQAFDLRLQE